MKQNLLDKGSGLALNAVTAELLSVSDRLERERQMDDFGKKPKTNPLALFAKLSLGGENPGKRKGIKGGKFKPRPRRAESTCHTCSEKGHWSLDCPKRGKGKERNKLGSSAHVAVESPRSHEIGKILMVLSSCSETGHVDMAYTIGTVNGILLDCTATSHMFLDHHLFIFYRPCHESPLQEFD